jgi:hypothetical protein
MTDKASTIELIRRLPDDATLAEIIEALEVRRCLDERLREIDADGGVSHDEVILRLSRFLD